MVRLPRVAALAVLVAALCCGLRATASPVPSAHLEIARVFNPQSESLLAPLLAPLYAPAREISFISQALFNIAFSPAPLPARVYEPGRVNLNAVAPIRTFTAPPVTAYVPPPSTQAPIEVPLASPEQYAVAPAEIANPIAIRTNVPQVRFGAYAPYAPALKAMSANVNIPVRVGDVHFSGIVSGSQTQSSHTDALRAVQLCGTVDEGAACPYLHESKAQSVVAGTDFTVRTGDRNVNLQISGSVEHLSNGDAQIFPYVPLDPEESFDATARGAAGSPENAMLQYPGVTALVKHGVDAKVAVPLTQRVTLGLQYDTSHYQGDYGALVQGLDARKDTYLGNVTYQLPNSSAITLSTRLYRYQDGLVQNFNLTQTRTDLNFTVKF